MIEPSRARYRSAVAFQRLANALGVQLLPTDEDCVCLERLATQAERWNLLDQQGLEAHTEALSRFENPSTEELESDLDERVTADMADERAREDWEDRQG